LDSHTTYYYEVQSTSSEGYTIIDNNGGRYYTFTTENNLPNIPRKPNPTDNKMNVKTTIVLSWIGGDEDGDDVFYDVYLGTENPPLTLVNSSQSEEFYDPDPDLSTSTTYYWQIIARDVQGATTVGPIWSFETR